MVPPKWMNIWREKTPNSLLEDPGVPLIISPGCRQEKLTGHRERGESSHGRGHRSQERKFTLNSSQGREAHTGEQLTGGRTAHRGKKLTWENSSHGREADRGEGRRRKQQLAPVGVFLLSLCLSLRPASRADQMLSCCRWDTISKSRGCLVNCGKEAELCTESLSYQFHIKSNDIQLQWF